MIYIQKYDIQHIKQKTNKYPKQYYTTYNMIIEVTRDGVSACVPDRESRKEE